MSEEIKKLESIREKLLLSVGVPRECFEYDLAEFRKTELRRQEERFKKYSDRIRRCFLRCLLGIK